MKDKNRKMGIMRLLLAAVFLLPLASCSMFNTDDSGDLGGYWHLTRVDTLATAGVCDMSKAPVYWSVQGKILEVRNVDTGVFVMFRYAHEGSTLSLSDVRYNQRERDDEAISDVDVLRPYGINSLTESFTVEQLDGSRMTLKSEMLKLYFKKF